MNRDEIRVSDEQHTLPTAEKIVDMPIVKAKLSSLCVFSVRCFSDLSYNRIDVIDGDMFIGLSNLKQLLVFSFAFIIVARTTAHTVTRNRASFFRKQLNKLTELNTQGCRISRI